MSSKTQVFKIFTRCYASQVNLKEILSERIPKEQEKIKKFRKDHGNKKVGEVTVNMVYGGMRGIKALLCETSLLDPEKGIRFRGYSIPELQQKLPKAPESEQPLPEGIFWLMLTSEIPNKDQVSWLSQQWAQRANIPEYVQNLLNNFPKSLHPMAQLSCAITALHNDSHFSKAYLKGIKKHEYWKFVFEDAMDLIAKITVIAAIIYRNLYKGGAPRNLHETVDPCKDWAHNFTSMMSYPSFDMAELIRLYLTLHCDHEGGNVSSHTTHLVGSALGDCYLSYAAGINGLAGPLHGLANQEVLMWLKKCHHELGGSITKEQLADYIKATLTSGKVIPGYGHAVLRSTDPRYLCFREFAFKHFPDDPLFKLCSMCFEVVPQVLKATGKVANPWPNVDAHSGVLLQYYGLQEMEFYTVMFAVSRALGVLASLVWHRGLGLPIERPKSMTSKELRKVVGG